MSMKDRIKKLEGEAEARRLVRECVCSKLIIMDLDCEPTEEQQRALDAIRPCPVHPVVAVVEVGRAQPPLTMVQEALELEN